MAHLTTSSEVIEALGDTKIVAEWLGRPQQTVSSWKAGKIPARYFLVMQAALADEGHTALISVFGMLEPRKGPPPRPRKSLPNREAA